MSSSVTSSPAGASRRSSQSWRRGGLLLLAVIIFGGITWSRNRTYHFEPVEPGILYRSGNRGLAEFENAVRRGHVKTVVSLIDDQELADPNKPQFHDEETYLQQSGIRQERIPVKLGGWPTTDDVKRFIAIVADAANRPVLVHCAQGVRRTGMFVAAYQEAGLGFSRQQAKDAILTFGHSNHVAEDVRKFIDMYDPQLGLTAATMPTGTEE